MKVDGASVTCGARRAEGGYLSGAAASAKELEAQGYDGIWTAETSHDPFFPLLLAAQDTERVELGTGIAVAFARNPMNLAQIAWDLQAASQGRFILGLGSQIKPHITKRFSMPWSSPGRAHAGDDPRHPRHLGELERRHQARLPGRLLHAHPDDAVLQPRARTRTATPRSPSPASVS